MNGQTFILRVDNARPRMKAAWEFACRFLELGEAAKIRVEECKPRRTLEQNSKMWAMLTDIADQVQWQIDGKLEYLKPEEWKDILTAGLRKHQRVAAGIDGGFVILGDHTSGMTIGQMSEMIELCYAFGTEHGVAWSEPEARAA